MLRLAVARLRLRGRLVVEGHPQLEGKVRLDLAPGARVVLGDGCRIGYGTRMHVADGATVEIGAGARLGEGCVLIAHERIVIGASARLDDDVVLIDFDHASDDVERPIRLQGLITAPVEIGERAIVGAGAGVLRGVTVGEGARVGVRAVVTRDVEPGATATGVVPRAPQR